MERQTTVLPTSVSPNLPESRGELSDCLMRTLAQPTRRASSLRPFPPVPKGDSLTNEDLQLALYVCYELHYQSFNNVDDQWEWDPTLLTLREQLERQFLLDLRGSITDPVSDIAPVLNPLLTASTTGGVSGYLATSGELWQLREYVVHRSAYHLKEADPHTWVIPRLTGKAKRVLCDLQLDEYGHGRNEGTHADLFAVMMDGIGLSAEHGSYVNRIPAITLANVNLLSLFGLHRQWRGALLGTLAVAEIRSTPGSANLLKLLSRLGFDARVQRFYDEHVEADAAHEQMMRRDVLADLLSREPDLADSTAFGAQAALSTGALQAEHILRCWSDTKSSLLSALD